MLERLVNYSFKINAKQMVQMAKNYKTVKFRNYARKAKSPFMTYAGFESVLVPENNRKQRQEESNTNKYLNHVGFSFGLVINWYVLMISLAKLLSNI